MTVITRFAPSPTGMLHIGGARTALFNWLYARHHGGRFYLRIEDTDRARSTDEAIQAIIEGMKWLELDWDGDVIHQFVRAPRHAEKAEQLLAEGKAYRCYVSPEELKEQREAAQKDKKQFKFTSPWRDANPATAPADQPSVIRLKSPDSGTITIKDEVQGEISVDAKELDDMVLLRSDGTPTYMLAVVVDDHDIAVTHVIRGADHLTNSFRQKLLYDAFGWETPIFAHIPLIHGADGAKLSKRHGAQGVGDYAEMGYLPEAMRNYLLRLGWAKGDEEIIPTDKAIEWFGLEGIGKSPSRFDFAKLDNLNGHYMRQADDQALLALIQPKLGELNELQTSRLLKGMDGLKQRAKNLKELAENAKFYTTDGAPELDEKAKAQLEGDGKSHITALIPLYDAAASWDQETLQQIARDYAESHDTKLGKVAQPLRAALTGSTISPSVFEVMEVLGKDESMKRLKAV